MHFYSKLLKNVDSVELTSFVKRVKMTLNENILSTIMGTEYRGEIYFENVSRKEQLWVLYG